jgi:hypothetical protein
MTRSDTPRQIVKAVTQHSLAARLANLVRIQPTHWRVCPDARSPAEYLRTQLELHAHAKSRRDQNWREGTSSARPAGSGIAAKDHPRASRRQ